MVSLAGEIAQVVAEMAPYATAALSAYGGAVLAKVQDDAADATVSSGRRLLQRVFGRKRDGEPVPSVLAKVLANPGDADYLGALRSTIRDELTNDRQMLADVLQILAQAEPVMAVGSQEARADHGAIAQNVVAGGNVDASHTKNVTHGPSISAGRDVNYSERDMTIHRSPELLI